MADVRVPTRIAAFALTMLLLPLSGCQTAAEREATTIRDTVTRADAESQQCTNALYAKPEYARVFQRFWPSVNAQPTLAQMADQSVPTLDEARAFIDWHTENQKCRQRFVAAVQTTNPEFARAAQANHADVDEVFAALARQEISWGVANTRFMAVLAKTAERQDMATAQTNRRLEAAHQAEIARRRAAAAAFSAAAANMQQQQLINAANRPVMTNCHRLGNSVSCTSF